jgi:hypothetical protein
MKRPKMYDQFISFYDNLPIARALYSFALVIVIFLLIGQLASVWRSRISISDFSYFTDGKKNADYADQFRSETIVNYSMIVGVINADRFKIEQEGEDNGTTCDLENPRWYDAILNFFRRSESENRCQDNKSGLDAKAVGDLINSIHAEKVDDIAKTLDFSVEGVNLKGLLSAFSNLVTPPETTIVARLYENGGKKRAYVSLEGDLAEATRTSASTPLVSLLETPGSDSENAFRIACYLIWIQLNKARDFKSKSGIVRPAMSFEE